MRGLRVALLAALAALVLAPAAAAYPWPVKPFRQAHPVRGNFGDPRTIYWEAFDGEFTPLAGSFTFHNGVDISAAPGTPVYPVTAGRVTYAAGERVIVRARDRRVFHYIHLQVAAVEGQRVQPGRTVLGYVTQAAAHVHLTELTRGGRAVNPLDPGHLTPYVDATRPRIRGVYFRGLNGKKLDAFSIAGPVAFVVEAYDLPALPVPGSWNGLPVAPAYLTWSLRDPEGGAVIPRSTAFDFRRTLPFNRNFWRIYARGTYQNKPRFGDRQYGSMPGRYLYRLLPGLFDSRRLEDGSYYLEITVGDTVGNRWTRREPLVICNSTPDLCASLEVGKG